MEHFFLKKFLFFGGALGLGLTCLGLEPALVLKQHLVLRLANIHNPSEMHPG